MYLENNLDDGVFTPQHLQTFRGLCEQLSLLMGNPSQTSTLSADTRPSVTSKALMQSLQIQYDLTPREAEVAMLFKEGYTRSQVSEMLHIAHKTLKRHLSNIYDKTLNPEEAFNGEGRVEKLSRLILFLYRHSDKLKTSRCPTG